MNRLYFLIPLILSFAISKAQITFKSDASFMTWDTILLKEIDSSFNLEKNNEFELRCWMLSSLNIDSKLFILTKNNNKFNARFFDKNNDNAKYVEKLIDSRNLSHFWKELKKNHVLTIVDSDSLVDKNGKKLYNTVYGHTAYVIDLITEKNKRSYFYFCPKECFKTYPLIKEFKWFFNIINLIHQICRSAPNTDCG